MMVGPGTPRKLGSGALLLLLLLRTAAARDVAAARAAPWINAIEITALPRPISSAKMPPRAGLSLADDSRATIHSNPSA